MAKLKLAAVLLIIAVLPALVIAGPLSANISRTGLVLGLVVLNAVWAGCLFVVLKPLVQGEPERRIQLTSYLYILGVFTIAVLLTLFVFGTDERYLIVPYAAIHLATAPFLFLKQLRPSAIDIFIQSFWFHYVSLVLAIKALSAYALVFYIPAGVAHYIGDHSDAFFLAGIVFFMLSGAFISWLVNKLPIPRRTLPLLIAISYFTASSLAATRYL